MFEDIMFAISIIFATIGVVSILNYILLRVLVPKRGGSYILVISPESTGSDVAGLVYYLSLRFGIFGLFRKIKIKVVDCGMSEEAKEMCSVLKKQSSNIEVCSIKDIYQDIDDTRFTKTKS